MKDRIKLIRKTLDLTQRAFADRIGLKPNTIATYEIGRAVPSDSVINNICKEFRVNEHWFRTGEGEMFSKAPASELEALAAKYPNMTRDTYLLVEQLINLPSDEQEVITKFIRKIAASFVTEPSVSPKPPRKMSRSEAHAELDRQLDLEEKGAEELLGSGRGSSGTGAG